MIAMALLMAASLGPPALGSGSLVGGHGLGPSSLGTPSTSEPEGTGLSGLSSSLTVGSASCSLLLECRENDETGTLDLACSGSAGATFGNVGTPVFDTAGVFTDGVTEAITYGGSSDYHAAADAAPMYIGTSDFVIETIHKSDVSGRRILSSRGGGSGGLDLYTGGGGTTITLRVDDGTTSSISVASGALNGSVEHYMAFVDRDSATGQRSFIDAVGGAAVSPTSVGDVNPVGPATVGAYSTGITPISGDIYVVRMWTCTDLDPADYAAAVLARYSALYDL